VRLKIDVEAVRLVVSDVAIEEGTSTACPDGQPADHAKPLPGRSTCGATVRGRSLEPLARAEADPAHEQLQATPSGCWRLGRREPDVSVEHHCRWSTDGNFLLAEFTVQVGTARRAEGSPRIGWDPVARQIRSWIFDSAGGFAEGLWTHVEDGWVVKMTGVRAGRRYGLVHEQLPADGARRFLWASVDRIVGGETEPNVTVTIVRAPPKPRPQ